MLLLPLSPLRCMKPLPRGRPSGSRNIRMKMPRSLSANYGRIVNWIERTASGWDLIRQSVNVTLPSLDVTQDLAPTRKSVSRQRRIRLLDEKPIVYVVPVPAAKLHNPYWEECGFNAPAATWIWWRQYLPLPKLWCEAFAFRTFNRLLFGIFLAIFHM